MDFFEQPLCLGDRVAFVTSRGELRKAQIVKFYGEAPHRRVRLFTEGNRFTEAFCSVVIKEPL